MAATVRQIALVGHCGFDQFMLRRLVQEIAGDMPILSISDQQGLQQTAGPDTLLLINRRLDGLFDSDSGIDLIRNLAASDAPPAMMLVSDNAQAQQQAQQAGARPGFGKAALDEPETIELLNTMLHTT